jgi:single-stranded-DNA-specific exonuclease
MERSNIFLQGWGGHPSAVGLTIVGDQIEAFERCLNRCLSEDFPDGFPDVPLRVADTVRVADITPSFVDEFSRLEPFGQGNAAPVFHVTDVSWGPKITYFGSNDSHFRCCLEDSTIPLFVIGWHMGDKMRRHEASNERIHLATKISWNVWRNERQLQLQVVDWQN